MFRKTLESGNLQGAKEKKSSRQNDRFHGNCSKILGLIPHLKNVAHWPPLIQAWKKLFISFSFVLAEETEASSSVGAAESQAIKVSAKRQNINVLFGTLFFQSGFVKRGVPLLAKPFNYATFKRFNLITRVCP